MFCFFNIHTGFSKVCESCPVRSPKDHLLLSVGSEVYKVCQEHDALLPFLIKNNPSLPVVHNHKIKISAATEGQTLIQSKHTTEGTFCTCTYVSVILTLVSCHVNEQQCCMYLPTCVWVCVRMGGLD